MAYRKPKLSVMRIERAKQAMLGHKPLVAPAAGPRYVQDWTGDDEDDLYRLLEEWDPATGLRGLCDLLDDHRFSCGSLNGNLGLPPGTRCGGRPITAEDWARQR